MLNVGKYQNGAPYTRVSARHDWDARALSESVSRNDSKRKMFCLIVTIICGYYIL